VSNIDQLRSQIIDWSNRFPLDGSFRKKYNIAFGSEEHRKINQIDVYLEWLEEKLHSEFLEKAKQEIEDEKEFRKGNWLKDSQSDAEDEILFSKLNVSSINEQSQLAVE
jgi:hypothetical protein